MVLQLFPGNFGFGITVSHNNAAWGQAQLVKCLDGKTELRWGSDQDRAKAGEWMSPFWHEAVIGEGSGCRF